MNHPITAVLLAGGRGKRMNGDCPKVLIPIEGIPMIKRIVTTLDNPNISRIIVVTGELKKRIERILPSTIEYAIQAQPLGTADAFKQAMSIMSSDEISFVLPSDLPFIDESIVNSIIQFYMKHPRKAVVVGMKVENPKGFGRIVEIDDKVAIIEEKDASEEELKIKSINTGIYIFPNRLVRPLLPLLSTNNVAGEYYITDLIFLLSKFKKIRLLLLPEDYRLKGVNHREALEDLLIEKKNKS